MINQIILNQIEKFNPTNIDEIKNSMKEVLQNIILTGLGKTDFFNNAVFYGGTSLRIFRNLSRFSEDLDFTLTSSVSDFDFDKYLLLAKKELDALMIESDIYGKEKKNVVTTVESKHFRFNLKKLFEVTYPDYANQIISNETLTIKVEIEKACFDGGNTEIKILRYPSFAQVRTYDFETLFASKLLAILNRSWKTRVKGRDYYDYLFYISNDIYVNLNFLENGLKKFGYMEENEVLTIDRLKKDLKSKFESIDFEQAKLDVIPFIKKNDSFISAFNKDVFIGTLEYLKKKE